MIGEIFFKVENAIVEAFNFIYKKDVTSFVLLIGRADIVPEFKRFQKTQCVIDYMLDRANDETREHFYLRYMNRRYKKEGFKYEGEEGIDDLFVEMMIYAHLWDSHYFLKTLARMAGIVSNSQYLWETFIPDEGKWDFMQNKIIKPLKDNNLALGSIIERCFNSEIRNAFAHSLFSINADNRTIITHTRRGVNNYSFDDFQEKFLMSVILMNKLQNIQETYHDKWASLSGAVTEPFFTPDNVMVQIHGEMVNHGKEKYPEFRMYLIS